MNNQQITPGRDNLYFVIQADFGITNHMGSQSVARKLVEMCHVAKDSMLLVVGCGIGSSLIFLARELGCRITTIDSSPAMIARAAERVQQDGLENQVTLKVGNA